MRRPLIAIVIGSAVALGAAQAAPSFSASSQRLGGGSEQAEERSVSSTLEVILALIGFDLAATVEPIAREGVADGAGKPKECDRAKKTEVAKAEPKETEGGSSKGRARSGEPVYLAF